MNRSSSKRCKERRLEEAAQLLRRISDAQLEVLEESRLLLLVRLLVSMQMQVSNISTAFRKMDQVSLTVSLFTAQCLKQDVVSS